MSRRQLGMVLGFVIAVAIGTVLVSRFQRQVATTGSIDECTNYRWPVIVLDGDWRNALPRKVREFAPAYLPVISWPTGMRYDDAAHSVVDDEGSVLFRRGDRVRVRGEVVEVHGDPSPCYYIFNLEITELTAQ